MRERASGEVRLLPAFVESAGGLPTGLWSLLAPSVSADSAQGFGGTHQN